MRVLKVLLALLLLAVPCEAQVLKTGSLSNSGAYVSASIATAASVTVTITGSWGGTISFKASPTTPTCTDSVLVSAGTLVPGVQITSTTANGTWIIQNAGYVAACITGTSITSGSATVTVTRGFGSNNFVIQIGDAPSNGSRVPTLSDINNGSQVTARNNAVVEGCVAADADVSACNPVQIGASASTAVPTAMSTDGDSVRVWATKNGSLHILSTAGTPTLANVNDTNVSTTLISANTARLFAMCFNDSTVTLYINYGSTASTTAFTYLIPAQQTWTMDQPIYTGAIIGIWASDQSGAARCTELTQ